VSCARSWKVSAPPGRRSEEFRVFDELARTAAGKVQRFLLVERRAEGA
jgi:acyl-CoA synthetase (AMP-forming)/AMP-acid ligase II